LRGTSTGIRRYFAEALGARVSVYMSRSEVAWRS
jgi:hypothetical protein